MATWLMSGGMVIPIIKPGTTQNVSTSGTSAQSSAVGASTQYAALCCTEDCWIAIGANPTAAADASNNSFFLPAKLWLPVQITPGHKVAVIQDSTGGTLNIVEAA